jgi:16S rRNA pseudouridine516 synthase
MFPCGRLDIDTTGLLLITDDGALGHFLLSPRRHVAKTYRFTCDPPIGEDALRALCGGVDLGDFVTAPAELAPDGGTLPASSGEITVCEGKFHQIKRMFAACGSTVLTLERVRFGPLTLDEALAPGEWRYLTEAEEEALRAAGRGTPEKRESGRESPDRR